MFCDQPLSKKLLFFLYLIPLLLTGTALKANGATWSAVGPGGGNIHAIAVSPNYAVDQTIFAGTEGGGLYKSIDGGATWAPVNTGLGNLVVLSLGLSPGYATDQTIFAGTGGGGVYKSIDGGVTWSAANVGTGLAASKVLSLGLSPNYVTDKTLFAAGTDQLGVGVVYKSINGGGTWTTANSGLGNLPVSSLGLSSGYATDQTIFAGLYNPSQWGGDVYKSINGGATWTLVYGYGGHFIGLSPGYATDQTIFSQGHGYGDPSIYVMKSVNGGTTWSSASTGIGNSNVSSFGLSASYATDTTVFVGTNGGGVYRSINGGGTWAAVNTGLGDLQVTSLGLSPNYATDKILFAGTAFKGVYKSIDGGATWIPINTGLGNLNVYSVGLSPGYATDKTLFGGIWGVGVYKSIDAGSTWAPVNTGLGNLNVNSLGISPNFSIDQTLFAATEGGGVYISVDGGATWVTVNTGLGNLNVNSLGLSPGYATDKTLFAGARGGVYKSIDGGATWFGGSLIGCCFTGYYVYSLGLSPNYATDKTLFAGTSINNGWIYKSIDGGATWAAVNTGVVNFPVSSLGLSPGYATDNTLFAGTSGGGIYKSINGGATWSAANTGLGNLVVNSLALSPNYAADHTLFAGTPTGVYKSTDGGVAWTAVNTGLGNKYVKSLAISPGYPCDGTMFAGTMSSSVWKYVDTEAMATCKPVISSLSPTYGLPGSQVIITGTKLGVSQGTSTVTFNGLSSGSIISWSDTQVIAIVPIGASSGPVVVTVTGVSSNGVNFTITPSIVSILPNSGLVGSLVTITGSNFGVTQGASVVTFNGVNTGLATSWSDTEIIVTVPAGATSGPIVVTVNGVLSNGLDFAVVDPTPPTGSAFSVTPSSLTLGNSFTIFYTVSDSGGSGLNRVELWRADDSGGVAVGWAEVKRVTVSGNGPVSGSFTDAPASTGSYWYGYHVVDNAGNWSPEPSPPGPIKVTVKISDPSPADNITTLVADNTCIGATGTTPLILIHGIHGTSADEISSPNNNYWSNFLNYFCQNSAFTAKYKVYRFHYVSDEYSVWEIARALRNDLDAQIDAGTLSDVPFVIVAHSMGGLVARSYMQEHSHNTGNYTGQRGGERILNLITLATPHHGAPVANKDPRFTAISIDSVCNPLNLFPSWSDTANCYDDAFWLHYGCLQCTTDPTHYNRFDLRWDNFDSMWGSEYTNNSSERNDWLSGLNSSSTYDPKIIAYYGYIGPPSITTTDPIDPYVALYGPQSAREMRNQFYAFLSTYIIGPPASDGEFLGATSVLTERMIRQDTSGVITIVNNDGLVPKESAAFNNHTLFKTVECSHHNHNEMKDGGVGLCSSGLTLFNSISADLGVTPLDIIPPTASAFSVSPSSLTLGSAFTISYTVSDREGSGLNRVELWRANDSAGTPTGWAEIKRNTHSGNGPISGSFTDAPSSAGTYWYGVHVVDNAGNWGPEPNPPGPIKVTVNPADTTPDPFSFTAQTGVALNTVVTSNTMTVSGINAAAAISIAGASGQYSVNGGTYTNVAGTVTNGQTVTVKQTSSSSYDTMTTTTLTIGGVSAAFNVTTNLQTFILTVTKAGSGSGSVTSNPAGISCGPTCMASFDAGTVLTLTATPDATSVFAGWSGACTGTGTCTVTMDAAKLVTATFTAPTLSSITVTPAGPTIFVGQIQQFTATGTFSDGSTQVLTAGGGIWASKTPMSTGRYEHAVGVVDGILYAVGGNDSYLATVEAYDPMTNTWTSKASMPTGRWRHAVGVVNGILYAVGGYNSSSSLTTVEAYDPLTNTWTTKAPMPTGRYKPGVGVVNGTLYAVGGFNGSSLTTVEAYDPMTNTWTTKAPMSTARGAPGVGVVNGILYAVGGYNYNGSYPTTLITTVEAYDPLTNTWTTKASMSTGRYEHAVGVVNGVLYAVGGNDSYLATVEAYDPITNTWTTKASMSTARVIPAVGVVNGILYAVGGYDTSGVLAKVEAYTPSGEVTWSSSTTAVATIDQTGLATGVSPGTTTITASSGSVSGSTTLTVTSATPIQYNLSVAKGGTGGGTVTSNPAGITCGPTCGALFNSGTVLTLTATPDSNSTFTGWSGVCSGTGTCVLSMMADRAVTATFTLQPTASTRSVTKVTATSATLTGVANPNGAVGSAWFEYGPTMAYGVTTISRLISGSADLTLTEEVNGLTQWTIYHYRLCAQVSSQIACGSDALFTTRSSTLGGDGNISLVIAATAARVDGYDLIGLGLAFGADASMSNWNPLADLNGDGIVDGKDLTILAVNFGRVQ